jgi:branched-chain amino acid transport system substrate-binding protein
MHRSPTFHLDRRSFLTAAAASVTGVIASPWIARAQAKVIKIGMPTILSGRVAQLGSSSRNGLMMEVEKINAAGGLAGRQIEMIIRETPRGSHRKRPALPAN